METITEKRQICDFSKQYSSWCLEQNQQIQHGGFP
jgi:hypothetical protein